MEKSINKSLCLRLPTIVSDVQSRIQHCQDIFSSTFRLPSSLYIKRYIDNFKSPWAGSAKSGLFVITLITSLDHVWIAETLNPTHVSNVLWYFRSGKCYYLITYLITIYYYVDYLPGRSKILKTRDW